jgi:hypothetical protein
VQLDASVRAWLGGRGDEPVLISMIDASVDVTNGTSLSATYYIAHCYVKKSVLVLLHEGINVYVNL